MAIDSGRYERYTFLIFLVIGLYFSFTILKGYILSILGGAIIAYLLYPLYNYINRRIRSSSVSASIVSIITFIVIGGIIAITIPQVINEATRFYDVSERFFESQVDKLSSCETSDGLYCTLLGPYKEAVEQGSVRDASLNVAQRSSNFILYSITSNINSIANVLLKLVVMSFAVFYFLVNGNNFMIKSFNLIPMYKKHKTILVQKLKDTLDAVVKGNIITSLMQGVLGGLIFYILGISSPFLWGLFMTILAFIPSTGAAIVWVPAGLIFIFTGSIVKGVVLLIFGFLVLGYIDNILKPRLIANKIKVSSFLMFIGVIGGLGAFGIPGLFLGPVILSLTVVLLKFFKEEILNVGD